MIVKVGKGGRDMPGLAAYLWGPGQAEEHTDQHMIASTGAGDITLGESSMFYRGQTATALNDRSLEPGEAREQGRALEEAWRKHHGPRTPVSAGASRGGAQSGEQDGGDGEFRADSPYAGRDRGEGRKHVFHVSFALRADEGRLSDETWGRIAADYVQAMGFAGVEGEADCQWAAWRHGLSERGNDHVHVAVCLVRDDGRWANEHRSKLRSRRIADDLEEKYGLRPVKDSTAQRGMPAASAAELRRTREAEPGSKESIPERQRLAMIVRTSAAHASTEAQFIADLLRQGVRVRPRFAKGGQLAVEGASFAFRDGQGAWYSGSRLARDLTLPKLRAMWQDTPERRSEALSLWQGRRAVTESSKAAEWSPSWNAAQKSLAAWATRTERLDPHDTGAWVGVAREAATVSGELTRGSGGRQYALMAGATQELTRAAQTQRHVEAPVSDDVRVACRHLNLLLRGGSRSSAAGWFAVWQEFSRVNQAMKSAQAARGERVRAERVEHAAQRELASVQSGLRSAAATRTRIAPRGPRDRTQPTRDQEQGK